MWPLREATVWKARWQHLKRLDELVTSFISELGSIFSEEEQRTALEALLLGKDVFALPSTGFVKSLINRQAQLVVEIYSCWCDWWKLAWDTVIDSWFVQSPAKVFFSFFFFKLPAQTVLWGRLSRWFCVKNHLARQVWVKQLNFWNE